MGNTTAPCQDATVVVTDGTRRNTYSVPEVRWTAFVHAPAGLGMRLDVRSDDRQGATEEVEERDHIWDDGGRGPLLDGVWLAATTAMPLSFKAPMSFVVDDPTDVSSTWARDNFPAYGEWDLSCGFYWQSEHLGANSNRIGFSPCQVTSRWHIRWEGAVGPWVGAWAGDRKGERWLEAYAGFEVAGCISFGGVTLPDGMAESDAAAHIRALTSEPDHFQFVEGRYELVGCHLEDV